MAVKKFPVKGFREGLLISLSEGDWSDLVDNLMAQLDERVDFYRGAKLAIDVNERQIRASDMGSLRDQLSDRGITLFAILGKSSTTQAVAESLGLATTKSVLRDNRDGFSHALFEGEKAILIQKTLRSGTLVKFPGSVVVDGDVNPGAQVEANGSIYVWGKLRGSVHAGIDGSTDAVVCALDFNPMALRIADLEKEVPKLKIKLKKTLCKAKIVDGSIKLVEWMTKK
jgi:septum site-determining protein MinC